MTMPVNEADYIITDAMHVKYYIKTKGQFSPETDMYIVNEWVEKHNIEPKGYERIDAYLDEE